MAKEVIIYRKKGFFIKKKNKETNELTDQSPAQVETNGPETKYGIVVNSLYAEFVRFRSKPSFESEPIGVLRKYEKVEILERLDEFYKVRVEGHDVYVAAKYIKEEVKNE